MRHPNIALTEELTRAGWRPSRLAAAINQVLGEGYASRSTVSEWLHAGRVPREPLPALVAQLLTEATGHPISVHGLWPDAVLAPTWTVLADVGLAQIVAAPCPALALAHDWVRHADHQAGRDRRHFLPVSPAALPDGGHSAPTPAAASGVPWYVTGNQTAHQAAVLPVSPAVLRLAHRQVLALAQALIDLPHERGPPSALVLATTTAGQLAESLRARGLAQRYAASNAILLAIHWR